MRKFRLILALMLLSAATVLAQNKDQILMEIAGEPVTVGEFEYMYTKNLDLVQDPAQKDIDNYLQLFINYKLQLADAHAQGMDTVPSFLREFKRYRNDLAGKYATDRQITEKLLHEAYDRMQNDVNVSHIMVAVPQDATPADTLKAYKKIQNIYRQLKNGASFEELAKQYSDDPGSKDRGGKLGWINVFMTVYPFETAAYNTPAGQFSKPFRTRFGYHIVKVNAKRPAVYRVQVKQIMIVKGNNPGKAKQKIDEIYKQLTQGEAKFDDLARKFSDDKTSALHGGLLPPFGLHQKIEAFENQAFALKNPGDISAPFETPKAWHILQLKQKIPVPSFKRAKGDLERKIKRDSRSRLSREAMINRLKKRFPVEDKASLKPVYKLIDESYFQQKWKYPAQFKKAGKVLVVINKEDTLTYGDFLKWLYRHQLNNPKLYRIKKQFIRQQYEDFKNEKLLDYYKHNLERFNPEFKRTVKEYYDGLLLFNYKSKNIWEKSMKDTLGLKEYYKQHAGKYRIPDRYKAVYGEFDDKKTAKAVYKALKAGKSYAEIEKIAGKNLIRVRIKEGKPQGKPVLKKKGKKYFVEGYADYVPSYIPPLDQVRGKVLGDYQQYVEKQLLDQLKQKYPVKLHEDIWKQLRAKYKH